MIRPAPAPPAITRPATVLGDSAVIATYFGGAGYEGGVVAVDLAGSIYLAGTTESIDLPLTEIRLAAGPQGSIDLFVVKLAADGSEVWSVTIGGSGEDELWDIETDQTGAVYLLGSTNSADFPTTPGAIDTSYNGGELDVFVVKIAAGGGSVEFATYLGGSDREEGSGNVAVDSKGNAYVAGRTASADFPVTADAWQTTFGGGDGKLIPFGPGKDAFVAKLDPTGSELAFSTFIGGRGDDVSTGSPVLDPEGHVYVAGATTSADFPVVDAVFQKAYTGGPLSIPSDGFVVKLQPDGASAVWSTFVGGPSFDTLHSVAIDSSQGVYVAGSSCGEFPITEAVAQPRVGGDCDHVVGKLSADGTDLIYATYLGGSTGEFDNQRLVVDSFGRAWVVAETDAPDFPVTADAMQPNQGGNLDLTVTLLSPDGSSFIYSSYFGGSGTDSNFGSQPVLGPDGLLYISGVTNSIDMPTTTGAIQPEAAGNDDVLLLVVRGP